MIRTHLKVRQCLAIATFMVVGMAQADAETDQRETWVAPVEVFGTQSEVIEYPSEPQRVSSKKLEVFQTTDVARALKQVSGTYVREEDGFGLRPNIGMRGTSPDRSKKIVLLEDGILIGPAPYSAPAAYYTPSMMMVDSMEVYKGFGSLPFGPNSIGGTINYVTTPIPQSAETKLKLTAGSFRTYLLKGSTGGHLGDKVSYLIEGARLQTAGFKNLPTGESTGFEQNQLLMKWSLKLPSQNGLEHRLRLHLGYGTELSNETYIGLTALDFDRAPYDRMVSSEKDQMRWGHGKVQLHHQLQLSPTAMVQSAIYQHRFQRAWYRLDGMRNTSVNLRDVLRSPSSFSNEYEILMGRQDSSTLGTNGQLVVVNNDRTYQSRGLQNQWSIQFPGESLSNELEFSWRYHEDKIDRDHTSDRYEMTSGRMLKTSDPTQRDTLNSESAQALSMVLLDHAKVGPWTVSPAMRFESVRFTFADFLSGSRRPRSDQVWLPGLSVMRKIGSDSALKVSVNRAATLSGLSATGTERREEGLLYELEWSHANSELQSEAQAAVFFNDYQNITGTCTVSNGCTGNLLDTQFNGGKAAISGLEVKLAKKFAMGSVDLPISWTVTYLKARFANDFESTSPEWGLGQIQSGDPLPYVPELQSTVSVGLLWGRLFQELAIVYQGATYDQSVQLNRDQIEAFGIIDWAGHWSVSRTTKVVFKADNLLGKNYVVSARPYGLRPGKPQAFQVGLQMTF